jgi:epoxyqueuosine reductase
MDTIFNRISPEKDDSSVDSLLLAQFRQVAIEHGFPLIAWTTAQKSPGFERLCRWLDSGYAGEMHYLKNRQSAYEHPESVLPGVKSIVMLGMPYSPAPSQRSLKANGTSATNVLLNSKPFRLAAYASGQVDYHDLIHDRLRSLVVWLQRRLPMAKLRGIVDTAPFLERDFARIAGLGWIGKNTLLLNRDYGSYFFLAAILVDQEIAFEEAPMATDHCGSCTACLDACPTQAFVEPHMLDASRCVSYLTIEHRGIIPEDLRSGIGGWLFGCDACQQVCPWNRFAKPTQEETLKPSPDLVEVELVSWLKMDEDTFREKYRRTPFWRTKLTGMQRNAMIVIGNERKIDALPQIREFLSHPNVMLRATAAWAIGQFGTAESLQCLEEQLNHETDSAVRQELVNALQVATTRPRH